MTPLNEITNIRLARIERNRTLRRQAAILILGAAAILAVALAGTNL